MTATPDVIQQAISASQKHAETLLRRWLPEGKREGSEWVSTNPTRSDNHPGSFKINLNTGKWSDFATGDKGGDLVSLYAYRFAAKSQPDAARAVLEELGYPVDEPAAAKKDADVWTVIVDGVPDHAPPPPNRHYKFGAPAGVWTYTDAAGRVLHHVARFNQEPKVNGTKVKKDFFPISWCRSSTGAQEWRWKAFPEPRPLYNLLALATNPHAKVVFCEGEAKSIAAETLLPGYIHTCPSGGCKAASKADFEPLRGREVLVWPDADESGKAWLRTVLKHLTDLGCAISVVDTEGLDSTIGYDAKDALNEGWTAADVERRIHVESPRSPTYNERHSTILVEAGRVAEITDQAESAMIKYSGNFYQRSGALVRWSVSYAETVHGVTRSAGSVIILPMDVDYLIDRLNRLVEWQTTKPNGEVVLANTPRLVATSLLARAGEWKAQPLIAAINAPTIRPDGTLLDREGYDAKTGLLFANVSGLPYPTIPTNPTKEQAQSALALLKDVISGFPFAQEYDRSAALAAIMTATARHSMKNAPMFPFSAPRMASGKSLLADVVALIATGRPATVMSFTADQDEMRKRVMTILMSGDAVVNIDNVEEPLASAILCSVLTQESYTDRLLGSQRKATVPTLACWLATGNNLLVAGDLTTRIVPCNLDPQVERPEEREFARDLYQWIPEHRPALVAAILTILRAYVVAGRHQQPIKNFARFEDWSRSVRSALVWLGEPDPLLGLEQVEDSDPTRQKLRALLLAWYAKFQTAPATSKEAVFASLGESDESGESTTPQKSLIEKVLKEVLEDHFSGKDGEPNSRNIGNFLKKHAGRVEVGARFERGGSSKRRELWRVKVLEKSRFLKNFDEFMHGGEKTHQTRPDSPDSPEPATTPPMANDGAYRAKVKELAGQGIPATEPPRRALAELGGAIKEGV